jgi:hypothetical protein
VRHTWLNIVVNFTCVTNNFIRIEFPYNDIFLQQFRVSPSQLLYMAAKSISLLMRMQTLHVYKLHAITMSVFNFTVFNPKAGFLAIWENYL